MKFINSILVLTYKRVTFIERFLYAVRDWMWSYPDVFAKDHPYRIRFEKIYASTIPYSHFLFSFTLVFILSLPLFFTRLPRILGVSDQVLIEGVATGVDDLGLPQKITKVNPIITSNNQLEKDIVNLIYEPLLKYTYQSSIDGRNVGAIKGVLAKNILTLRAGANYEITIKDNVFWHDHIPNISERRLTTDDVIATFDLIKSLDENSSIYTKTLRQMQWKKIDEYTFRICTIPAIASVEICYNDNNESVQDDLGYPIFSNFLELIGFNILPKHKIGDINAINVNSTDPELFRSPIGTGKFKMEQVSPSFTRLKFFNNYHEILDDRTIDEIKFVYYKTTDDAFEALLNGEIHSLATTSTVFRDKAKPYNQIVEHLSQVLYKQFFGLYFNLRTNPSTNKPIAPQFLLDMRVRQAISSAINRNNIISVGLNGMGAEAFGPIPNISYFYNKDAGWKTYGSLDAGKLLDEAGWTLKPGYKFRTNDSGEVMRFSLYFVESVDRRAVAEIIKEDLAKIGIDVLIDRRQQPGQGTDDPEFWTLDELNNSMLLPGLFDVILYGMNTFVDPDRYELYHSSQIQFPGLNIAGYKSSEQTVAKKGERQANESSLVSVSKVDDRLEKARSFDPEKDIEARQEKYFEVQRILAHEVPVVYLYHPQFLYLHNRTLKNVDLTGAESIEDRFLNLEKWEL